MSLAEAEIWLNDSGNDTVIKAPKNNRDTQEIAFASGSYWQAVSAVAEAFDLVVAPAEQHLRLQGATFKAGGLQALHLGSGRVVLGPRGDRHRRPLISSGPLLIEVLDAAITDHQEPPQTTVEVHYHGRLEPHMDLSQVGYALIQWQPLAVRMPWPDAQRPAFLPAHDLFRGTRARLIQQPPVLSSLQASGPPQLLQHLTLDGQATVNVVTTGQSQITVGDGETVSFHIGPHAESWQLTFAEVSQHQQRQRARIAVVIPAQSTAQGMIRLIQRDPNGHSQNTYHLNQGINQRSDQPQTLQHFVVLPHAGPITLSVEADFRIANHTYPLQSTISFAGSRAR